ncbi:MAG: outer membrane protein assembly factor BamA [Trichloromonas sp.]|jgi:outer membrane protein insertion porin family|nr:outer membrane protein assembly factor BamA [Trichloromonas sp.]
MLLRLLTILLLLPSLAWSAATTIGEVRIEGAVRVEQSAIRSLLAAKAGEAYEPATVDRDLRAIFGMGRFEDVGAEIEEQDGAVLLTYRVVERPLVRKVEFTGNDEFSVDKLRGLVVVKTPDIYDPALVDKSVEALRGAYREEGYHAAEITPRVAIDDRNEATVTFDVKEGDKVLVDAIRFEGNTVFTDKELRKAMETRERWFLSWMTGRGKFNEDVLKDDLERVADLYYNVGHVRVKVRQRHVKLTDDNKHMDILIEVEEGPQFKVGKLDVTGDLLKDKADILNLSLLKEGEVFSRKLLRESVTAISDLYADQGYAYVNVTPVTKVDGERLLIDIAYDVEQGSQVTIDRINIAGNTKTRDKVIRRELKVTEGDLYSASKLKDSRRRVNNLGFFEEVNVTNKKGTDDSHMEVNVDVKERPTGTFSLGAGYSSVDGVIGQGSISQDNFLGKSWKLNLAGSFGGKSTTYQVGLLDPYFLDMNMALGFDLYRTNREWNDFTRDATGGAVKIGFPVGEDNRAFFTYRLEQKEISDVDETATKTLKDEEAKGKVLVSSLLSSLTRNTTDYHMDPTTGYVAEGSVEFAGLGGDEKFVKYIADYRHFWPVLWSTVFSVHGQIGYISQLGGEEIPVDERFYLGGLNSLRGFKSREVGPYDVANDEFTGGDKAAFFNIEYLFPILKDAGLKGVAFFDGGNAWGEDEDYFSEMRYSVGAGLRWMSPMGPLRLEWGYNLDPMDYEDTSEFEFSIGKFY